MNKCKCGKKLGDYRSLRCQSCAKKSKRNPNYKHGLCSEQHYCINCNKRLSSYYAKRCRSCSKKGNLHSQFKGGFPKCMDCGKTVNNRYAKRCRLCFGKSEIGKGNPNYIDGRAQFFYTYEFNNELKNQIRKRDNYKCRNCGIKEKNHFRKLDIHHIDYNRKNCKETNLITTCNKCNVKANYNRIYWTKFYGKLIKEIYCG